MDTVIREINESLLKILSDLESRKVASQSELNTVNSKINDKVDEAKEYKAEVDSAKGKIKDLEKEIEALEIDLTDLNERFGKKDLNAIVEAGNREINSKIMEKQNQITKYRQKIGELTERARSIKELLINLKKDKNSKEDKLDIITKSYDYYNESINKIIEFAKNNPNSLNTFEQPYTNLNYDYTQEPLTEVFDEIEEMDKEDSVEETSTEKHENIIKFDSEEISEEEENNLNNIFEKLQTKSLDFEELNKSIDKEYSNIFGNGEDISLDISENDLNTPLTENNYSPKNIFDDASDEVNLNEELKMPDFFGNNSLDNDSEINELFKNYDLSLEKFSKQDQELIKNIFSKEHFQKILAILKDNQLDLNKVYNAVSIFEKITAEDLDQIITKLLLANQTKANIELVLESLVEIKTNYLAEAISEFGANIKEANITDLITKAKKLSGDIDINKDTSYLLNLDFNQNEISKLESSISIENLEKIQLFPELVKTNYEFLKNIGVTNMKEIFMGHPQMFIINPDKFKAIFSKYDKADLIRCLEKNAAVIEKL